MQTSGDESRKFHFQKYFNPYSIQMSMSQLTPRSDTHHSIKIDDWTTSS